jgi:hypothetical protein
LTAEGFEQQVGQRVEQLLRRRLRRVLFAAVLEIEH